MTPGAATNGSAATPARVSDLLRVATSGSVDDGKSTLIGRLLFDSKQVFDDQMEHVEDVSERRGDGYVNLALLTDGLRAEREQGITIDVAYRYFATPRRKFIIADTPGHIQYTRNMVTGASTADLAILLVDARKGILEQTRRHAHIAALLGIPHLLVCVNKMDLVGYDEAIFERIEDEFRAFASGLEIHELTVIPISALNGDNVVDRSQNMDWYAGPPVLHHLEHVHVASDRNLHDARFPVQYVIRPQSEEHPDYRGYAGQLASGILRPGDEVVVLPSGRETRIAAIDTFEGEVAEAFPPMSVTLRLEDEVDVSRGDMIVHAGNRPAETREVEAIVCWMADAPLRAGVRYSLKHTTSTVRAVVDAVEHTIDVDTLVPDPTATELRLNEIGLVRLRTSAPLLLDPYRTNRRTGAFILVDETTNVTVGAGMVE